MLMWPVSREVALQRASIARAGAGNDSADDVKHVTPINPNNRPTDRPNADAESCMSAAASSVEQKLIVQSPCTMQSSRLECTIFCHHAAGYCVRRPDDLLHNTAIRIANRSSDPFIISRRGGFSTM